MTASAIRGILATAIANIDLVAAVLPSLGPSADSTRCRARLKATSCELAILRSRLREDHAPESVEAGELRSLNG